jgi:hypothetical protein
MWIFYSIGSEASSCSAKREAMLSGLRGNFEAYKYPQQ